MARKIGGAFRTKIELAGVSPDCRLADSRQRATPRHEDRQPTLPRPSLRRFPSSSGLSECLVDTVFSTR